MTAADAPYFVPLMFCANGPSSSTSTRRDRSTARRGSASTARRGRRRRPRCRGCRSPIRDSGATLPTGLLLDTAVVVAHDEDRVGAARRRGRLDRVVADEAGRVERELVAAGDLVQLGADVRTSAVNWPSEPDDERLEVEVDAVGARGRGRPARSVAPGGRRAVELPSSAFWRVLPLEVQAKLWTVRTTRVPVRVGGVDDRCHLRARPAAPADRRRAVAVALLEVAVGGRRRRRSRRSSRSCRS